MSHSCLIHFTLPCRRTRQISFFADYSFLGNLNRFPLLGTLIRHTNEQTLTMHSTFMLLTGVTIILGLQNLSESCFSVTIVSRLR